MKKKQIAITLGIMCFLLTIAICVQIRTMSSANSTVSKTLSDNGLRDEVLKMKEKYDSTYKDLENAEKELEEVRQEATQNDSTAEAKEQELKENNMILGNTNVTGEGVEIILQDAINTNNSFNLSDQLIHYGDIQWVVNELKNAGAEAIEVNGQRILEPYVIKVIGNQSHLESAVTGNGGKVEELQTLGHTATIEKDNDITIGKYNGEIETKYIE